MNKKLKRISIIPLAFIGLAGWIFELLTIFERVTQPSSEGLSALVGIFFFGPVLLFIAVLGLIFFIKVIRVFIKSDPWKPHAAFSLLVIFGLLSWAAMIPQFRSTWLGHQIYRGKMRTYINNEMGYSIQYPAIWYKITTGTTQIAGKKVATNVAFAETTQEATQSSLRVSLTASPAPRPENRVNSKTVPFALNDAMVGYLSGSFDSKNFSAWNQGIQLGVFFSDNYKTHLQTVESLRWLHPDFDAGNSDILSSTTTVGNQILDRQCTNDSGCALISTNPNLINTELCDFRNAEFTAVSAMSVGRQPGVEPCPGPDMRITGYYGRCLQGTCIRSHKIVPNEGDFVNVGTQKK